MTAPNSQSLHTRLAEIENYLNQSRQQVLQFVDSVPEPLRATRAQADRWSVAENIEHLAIVEDGIGRLMTKLIRGLQSDGAPQETESSSLLGSLDHIDVINNPRRITAPGTIAPTGTVPLTESLPRLASTRERFLQTVHAANGLDLTKAKAPHPAFGEINAYQWLVFVGQHELRHLRQMQDTVQKLTTLST